MAADETVAEVEIARRRERFAAKLDGIAERERVAKLVAIFATLALVAILGWQNVKLTEKADRAQKQADRQECIARLSVQPWIGFSGLLRAPVGDQVARDKANAQILAAAQKLGHLDRYCPS